MPKMKRRYRRSVIFSRLRRKSSSFRPEDNRFQRFIKLNCYCAPWHATETGESLMVLLFFSTHMDLGSARLLMITTITTPLGDAKSFLGGSSAQSIRWLAMAP